MMENILYKLYTFLELIDCSNVTINFAFIINEERKIIRIYGLFVASLLTKEENVFQLLNMNEDDVTLITSDSQDLLFSKLQVLKFLNSISSIDSNMGLIATENVLQFITSVFESQDTIAEQELAGVILSRVFASNLDLNVMPMDENCDSEIISSVGKLMSTAINDIALHAQEAMDSFSDEERGVRICLTLQEILAAISSEDNSSVITDIATVPLAVNVLCLYMKLHLEHIGKFEMYKMLCVHFEAARTQCPGKMCAIIDYYLS